MPPVPGTPSPAQPPAQTPGQSPPPGSRPEPAGPVLFLVALALVGLLVVAWGAAHPGSAVREGSEGSDPSAAALPAPDRTSFPEASEVPEPPEAAAGVEDVEADTGHAVVRRGEPAHEERAALPHGGRRVFAGGRFLVAYYGTAGTGALGVLGETDPDRMHRRLTRAAAPFRRPGAPVQPVHELIVTIADRVPGPDGDYSHDIARRDVQRHIDAAQRQGALLLLDLQPGRADFPTVARRWAWALRHPWVGLALDPEWRMGPRQVPGTVIGSVRAAEVNRTSAWLADLVRRHDLPEKLFVLHQFRTSMLPDAGRIRVRPGLATVQHADGFGTRRQKLATYRTIARPRQFVMGLKLFYDEDRDLMGAPAVHAIRPRVRFVSYQ